MSEIAGLIQQVGDLERLISKVAVSRINPREVVQLKRALRAVVTHHGNCAVKAVVNLLKFSVNS